MIRYARYYGLHEYQREENLINIVAQILPTQDIQASAVDFEGAPVPDVSKISYCNEKLELPKGSALFLQDVLASVAEPAQGHSLDGHKRYKHLRLELPMLRTDHELDVVDFMNDRHIYCCLEDVPKQKYNVDEEADEGLTWPKRYQNLSKILNQQLRSERLEISSKSLGLLASVMDSSNGQSNGDVALDEDIKYRRVCIS